jgi:hypothetical protein
LGITFHEAWTHDFPKFYEDLGPAKPGKSSLVAIYAGILSRGTVTGAVGATLESR